MPSQRKRIGFLPRSEVQSIIDQICKQNKLSQSKVTGILVEEALTYRGVLNNNLNNETKVRKSDYMGSLLINNTNTNSKKDKKNENYNLDDVYIKHEVEMINDFIEFKFFKNIMNNNKSKFMT